MSRRSILVVACLAATTLAWSAPKGKDVTRAGRQLGRVASEEGLSEEDARHAVLVLQRLADAGLPVSHALEVVTAAVERKLERQDVAALGREVERAYRRGASSRELVNLTEDLTDAGAGMNGILTAIDAVGRLAEEGYTDAETRRGVALRVLGGLRDGLKGQELSETVHDDARNDAEKGKAEEARGGADHGKAAAAKDRQKDKIPPDLRDERRGKPPGGPGKGKPGGK